MAHAKYGDMVLLHGGGPGVEKIAGKLGRGPRRQPDRLPPRLVRPRQGRALQTQRRPPQPAAQGRHRLPRQRYHRQPRRQGSHVGDTGLQRQGRVTATLASPVGGGPRFGEGRLLIFSPCPPNACRGSAHPRLCRSRSIRRPSPPQPRHRVPPGAAHRRWTLAPQQPGHRSPLRDTAIGLASAAPSARPPWRSAGTPPVGFPVTALAIPRSPRPPAMVTRTPSAPRASLVLERTAPLAFGSARHRPARSEHRDPRRSSAVIACAAITVIDLASAAPSARPQP